MTPPSRSCKASQDPRQPIWGFAFPAGATTHGSNLGWRSRQDWHFSLVGDCAELEASDVAWFSYLPSYAY
jgi:hypothetical protein